jgi:hypothetical protein
MLLHNTVQWKTERRLNRERMLTESESKAAEQPEGKITGPSRNIY